MFPPHEHTRFQPRHGSEPLSQSQPLAGAEILSDRRQSFGLRSAAALLFAIGFLWPDLPREMLIRLLAGYAFVDGILALAPGGWRLPRAVAWPLLIGGCIDLVAAALVCAWPDLTPDALASAIAVWALASGVALTFACIALRDGDTDHLLLLGGIASLVFGRALMSQLANDVIVLSTWIGLYALTMGVITLKLTLRHSRLLLTF